MNAEVIAIGDELTSGERLDTNSQWLSRRLGEIGVRVDFHTTVADDLPALTEAFRIATERADFVLSTGGLGPTADDLTRDALAAATGRELQLDAEVLEHIRRLFGRRGRAMPERNRVQAMFPSGSRVIPNPHGTAPGIDLERPREGRTPSRIYAFPGVPAELFQMWRETVRPQIAAAVGVGHVIRHRELKCFGVGESHLEEMLPDLVRRGRSPSVGITVHQGTITLRITARAESEQGCETLIEPTVRTIRDALGKLVFGEGPDELQHAVARLLSERQKTLATVEWGTAGLLARWMGEVSHIGSRYLGGIVLADERAADWLELSAGIANDVAKNWSEADEPMVQALAKSARERWPADYVLAVGPLPEPEQETDSTAAFHVALAGPDHIRTRSFPSAAHPDIRLPLAAKRALNYLRLSLT